MFICFENRLFDESDMKIGHLIIEASLVSIDLDR